MDPLTKFPTQNHNQFGFFKASLKKRSDIYYIHFFTKANGKKKRKAFSLGTTIKREEQRLLIEYEDKFQRGEIDPFNGWNPQKEAQKKRQRLRGKYIPLHKAADQFNEQRSQANAKTKANYRRHMNMLMGHVGKTMPVTCATTKSFFGGCTKRKF